MAVQTWTSLQTMLLASLVKAQPPYNVIPPDFAVLFPQATSYAENRIYRDIVLIGTRLANTSLTTATGSRTVSLSSMVNVGGGAILVPEGFALITPISTSAQAGTRVPFDVGTLDVIDQIWPVESATVAPSLNSFGPRYWAMLDDRTIVYAPTADAAYTVEITGLFQPSPISPSNPVTYLSTNFPALLEAACMVFLTGALTHNFGSQADNPKSAMSWENLYVTLMQSSKDEEARRRGLIPDRSPPAAGGAA